MRTAVVLTVFNRPELTARVFSAVAKARPARLYVIADAPRANRPGEAEQCAAARNVVERIDWNCDVAMNYSDVNLGPRRRLSTGINWVFEREQAAIILEHDCLPDQAFFPFCEQLLDKYHDDQRVMHIGGNNYLFGRVPIKDSYCFSSITHQWGFATWRRSWQLYDVDMKAWPMLRNSSLLPKALLGDKQCEEYFANILDQTYAGAIDTWDYQWLLTCWHNDGLAVIPRTNLVSNIGFGKDALNCGDVYDTLSNLRTEPMRFPLRHPSQVVRNREADQFVIERILVPSNRRQMNRRRNWFSSLRKRLAIRSRIKALTRTCP